MTDSTESSDQTTRAPLVVGVHPSQPDFVLRHAAGLAAALGTSLVCCWVDSSHLRAGPDVLAAINPDTEDPDIGEASADATLLTWLREELTGSEVPWQYVHAVGDVSHALAEVAQTHRAAMVVVGTRRPGLTGWMAEAIGGSVAGHLAHAHHTPVLVVPPPASGA